MNTIRQAWAAEEITEELDLWHLNERMTVRTDEEISALIAKLEKEVETLPQYNFFGDSNDEARAEILAFVTDLRGVLAGKPAKLSETQRWLDGRPSDLNDYD